MVFCWQCGLGTACWGLMRMTDLTHIDIHCEIIVLTKVKKSWIGHFLFMCNLKILQINSLTLIRYSVWQQLTTAYVVLTGKQGRDKKKSLTFTRECEVFTVQTHHKLTISNRCCSNHPNWDYRSNIFIFNSGFLKYAIRLLLFLLYAVCILCTASFLLHGIQ